MLLLVELELAEFRIYPEKNPILTLRDLHPPGKFPIPASNIRIQSFGQD